MKPAKCFFIYAFVGGLILAMSTLAVCTRADQAPADEKPPSATSRPAEPAEIKSIIDRAELALHNETSNVSDVLSGSQYLQVHGWPRFRALIKSHAKGSRITMATPQEPGQRLRARIQIMKSNGEKAAGTLVYLYHTDSRGDYGPNDAQVPLAGSDNNYARLFGYALTDSDGTIDVHTIRPGGYPDSEFPAHIHLRMWCKDDQRSFGAEIWFEDDPRITREMRKEAAKDRIVICPVTVDKDGRASIDATIKLD